MDIRTIPVNGWMTNVTSLERVFPAHIEEQGRRVIEEWTQHFPKEETWVERTLGVPSLIVRLDCTVADGQLVVYEVEERPAGIGATTGFNPSFVGRLRAIRETWPDFSVVLSPWRSGGDDYLWQSVSQTPPAEGLVLVRAEPEEKEFHHLADRSVSSVRVKGTKSYGVPMHLWWHTFDASRLPWQSTAFVVKPCQGSKTHDVEIWDPEKRPGCSTRSRIERTFTRHTLFGMYCQKFVPPMETGIPEYRWMIFRVYYGYDVTRRAWVCLGGNWNARSNLKIHGASDALFGPLVVS